MTNTGPFLLLAALMILSIFIVDPWSLDIDDHRIKVYLVVAGVWIFMAGVMAL